MCVLLILVYRQGRQRLQNGRGSNKNLEVLEIQTDKANLSLR